jgi:hypothetical protein
MTILARLVSPSARSLAVMIGHGQSGEGRGRRALRGSPQVCGVAPQLPSHPLSQFPSFSPQE